MMRDSTPPRNENQRKEQIFKNESNLAMWELRHVKVSELIARLNLKRIIDFGCSEGELMLRLSRSEKIELFVGIDIDQEVVQEAKKKYYPELIQSQLQFSRENEQHLYLFKGDISNQSIKLKKFKPELITLVEVIEHLPLDLIDKVVFNIFGYMRPPFVFISTPNKEFNVFFKFKNGKLRHYDHKFQWTRDEFLQFCNKIKNVYGYDFEIDGVGQHIQDQSNGFSTQIAFFSLKQRKFYENIELIPKQPELVCHTINKSWRQNQRRLLFESIKNTLNNKSKISWKHAIRLIQKQKIGKAMNKRNQDIDPQLLISIIIEYGQGSIHFDKEGYHRNQEQETADPDIQQH